MSGAPITNFGYTDYDSVGNVTCRYLRCPSTLELLIAKDFCFPPLEYRALQRPEITNIWNSCLTLFLSFPTEMQNAVVGCIYRLWNSHMLAVDFRVPLIVSGLEVVAKEWCKLQHISMGNEPILDPKKFESFAGGLIQMIHSAISADDTIEQEKKDSILRKLNQLNLTRKKSLPELYDSLDIHLSDEEREMILFRNAVTHEMSSLTDATFHDGVSIFYCAVNLCHRTILSLLGDDLRRLKTY